MSVIKENSKEYNDLYHIYNLNDISNQINCKKRQFAKYLYDNYISNGEKTISYTTFLSKIFKKRRDNVSTIKLIDAETSEKICRFIVWNNGKLRQCNKIKLIGEDFCHIHINEDNILEDEYDYPEDIEDNDDDDDDNNIEEYTDN